MAISIASGGVASLSAGAASPAINGTPALNDVLVVVCVTTPSAIGLGANATDSAIARGSANPWLPLIINGYVIDSTNALYHQAWYKQVNADDVAHGWGTTPTVTVQATAAGGNGMALVTWHTGFVGAVGIDAAAHTGGGYTVPLMDQTTNLGSNTVTMPSFKSGVVTENYVGGLAVNANIGNGSTQPELTFGITNYNQSNVGIVGANPTGQAFAIFNAGSGLTAKVNLLWQSFTSNKKSLAWGVGIYDTFNVPGVATGTISLSGDTSIGSPAYTSPATGSISLSGDTTAGTQGFFGVATGSISLSGDTTVGAPGYTSPATGIISITSTATGTIGSYNFTGVATGTISLGSLATAGYAAVGTGTISLSGDQTDVSYAFTSVATGTLSLTSTSVSSIGFPAIGSISITSNAVSSIGFPATGFISLQSASFGIWYEPGYALATGSISLFGVATGVFAAVTLTPVRVVGQYLRYDGNPATTGTVTFQLTHAMMDSFTNEIIPAHPHVTYVNENGQILDQDGSPIILPANDDPTTQPRNVAYTVVEEIGESTTRIYEIVISRLTPNLIFDLATASPVQVSPNYEYILTSAIGAPNGVAPLDGNSQVPLQFLESIPVFNVVGIDGGEI